jgi:hypothetical protein
LWCRWDKEKHDAAAKDRAENEEQFSPDARKKATKERGSIREQARRLLSAKERREEALDLRRERLKGRGRDADVEEEGEWVDDGEAVEVETDIDVSKVPRSWYRIIEIERVYI